MAVQSNSDAFLLSLDRCAESEQFVPSFYKRFLAASDEIAAKFRKTNFDVQNRMLIRSLRLVAGAVAGERAALQELRDRAETHDRRHLDVSPHLYEIWLEALIKTASEYDDRWDARVESAWRETLQHVINQMIHYY